MIKRLTVTIAMHAVVAAIGASPAYASAYFVTSVADTVSADGVCTLREAMFAAEDVPKNGDCGPSFDEFDTIFIWVPGTIVLAHDLPEITKGVAILGHGSDGTTIDANGRARPFFIGGPVDVRLERLTITNGKAPNGSGLASPHGEHGGAIYNLGRLDLTDVRITHSAAGNGFLTNVGEGGHGGAIYNAGEIVGYRVTFDKNSAGWGAATFDYFYKGGFGGAIYNASGGTLILFAATFTENAQGRDHGHGAAMYSLGLAIIKSSTFERNGIPERFYETASLVTDGAGVTALSSTIMADRSGCLAIGPGPGGFIDIGFNLGLIDQPGLGVCTFTPAAGSIVEFFGQPVLDSELRNNGGFVPTLAFVLPTHPAVNRVPASFEDCAPGRLLPLGLPFDLTDARGVPRPQNGSCDIGAFEIGGPSFRRAQRTLAIAGAGSGQGMVSGDGLECAIAGGTTSGQCSGEYDPGTVVDATPTAAAGSIFVGWAGDPECADGSVLMDGDKSCTAIFDLRGRSVRGSANGVGHVRPPKSQGRAEVTFNAEFAFAGAIDLASATVTINMLLGEEEPGGAGELVQGVPIVLQAVTGGSTAAIFETPTGVAPRVTMEVQSAQPALSTVAIAIAGATIDRFPALCATAKPPATTLTTRFTIDDGVNPPLTVTAKEPWRCLAPIAGDKLRPRLLKTP